MIGYVCVCVCGFIYIYIYIYIYIIIFKPDQGQEGRRGKIEIKKVCVFTYVGLPAET